MANLVVAGAMLSCNCSQTQTPAPLKVTIPKSTKVDGKSVATAVDMMPLMNIGPFGVCSKLTAMASGTPTPCMPPSFLPWNQTSKQFTVDGQATLINDSTIMCALGGKVSVQSNRTNVNVR